MCACLPACLTPTTPQYPVAPRLLGQVPAEDLELALPPPHSPLSLEPAAVITALITGALHPGVTLTATIGVAFVQYNMQSYSLAFLINGLLEASLDPTSTTPDTVT